MLDRDRASEPFHFLLATWADYIFPTHLWSEPSGPGCRRCNLCRRFCSHYAHLLPLHLLVSNFVLFVSFLEWCVLLAAIKPVHGGFQSFDTPFYPYLFLFI